MGKRKNPIPGKDNNFAGMMATIMLSVLFVLIGALMSFVSGFKIVYFVYITGGVFLAGGIWLIARFFIRRGYHVMTNYDFSSGTLIAILGVIAIMRAKDISKGIYTYIGILLLVEAVLLLQYTIQLWGMNGKSWSFTLILSLLILAFSLLILTDFLTIFTRDPDLMYALLLVSGILGVIAIITVAVRAYSYRKEVAVSNRRNMEESAEALTPVIRMTAPQPQPIAEENFSDTNPTGERQTENAVTSEADKAQSAEDQPENTSEPIDSKEAESPENVDSFAESGKEEDTVGFFKFKRKQKK